MKIGTIPNEVDLVGPAHKTHLIENCANSQMARGSCYNVVVNWENIFTQYPWCHTLSMIWTIKWLIKWLREWPLVSPSVTNSFSYRLWWREKEIKPPIMHCKLPAWRWYAHIAWWHSGSVPHFMPPKVCQMLFWQTKNGPHFTNIWDTVTNVVPLHSVHQAPSYEPNLIFLAQFPTELAYLSMLFILEVLCTACSAEHLKNK